VQAKWNYFFRTTTHNGGTVCFVPVFFTLAQIMYLHSIWN